ncbi:MAG: hypothetical protein AAB263_00440 [Planctomycetota bacterium]
MSLLETALEVNPAMPPIDTYSRRASVLAQLCMVDGGFDIERGALMDADAASRLYGPITYRGTTAPHGCDGWGIDHSFPGNFFGAPYQQVAREMGLDKSFLAVIDDYDLCLTNAGYSALPMLDGLNEKAATDAVSAYQQAAIKCDEMSGRGAAERNLEVQIGDAFVDRYPDLVTEYRSTILSELRSIGAL